VRREAPKTILSIAFPPDGKVDWYVTNPDITFDVSNPIAGVEYRTKYRFDGEGGEIEWDGSPIKIPSDGQHILEYRSVAVVNDDFAVTPGRHIVSVPRYFSELPRKFLFKLDTTKPKVGTGLTDLFDSRVLITDDFFTNDGSTVLTSVMAGKASGSVFLRSSPEIDPPPGATVVDPQEDGDYSFQISATRLVPSSLSLRTSSGSLEEHADYKADYFEASGKVFVDRIAAGSLPIDEEIFWEIDTRDVVRYENRDGRQRFIVRFQASPQVVTVEIPDTGLDVQTGLAAIDLVSLLTDVLLTDESGAKFTPGPGTFELIDDDGQILLRNNSSGLLASGAPATLRVMSIQNKAGLERVGFVDDGTAFLMDEGTGRVFGPSSFSLSFDAKAQLLSVQRLDATIPRDSDMVLELRLEQRDHTSKFIDFGTYNAPSATRKFSINKEQSVWYFARDACPKPIEEPVANIVVDDIESGVDKIFFTFNGGDPVEGESEFIEAPSAVLPAPDSFRNRFAFKWLATDRAGNNDTGFFTNVGDALAAPLIVPSSLLTKPVEKIHFAPDGEPIDESSPFVMQSGDFIVIDKGVCQGCVDVNFIVVYTDGSRATGFTSVCVVNDFLIGSFVPQIVSEFEIGDEDAQGRRWFRGFRPIVVLPIFGPRPSDLDPATPFPSKIFWKWSDEDVFKEYTQPFSLRSVGKNVLNLYVSFIDGSDSGTESDAFQFTYHWDNERPQVFDNTEQKWLNRDATVFFSFQETGSGVKALFFRVWKETLDTPPGPTADAQNLVNLNDVVDFLVAEDPVSRTELQPQDLTDDQINEYIRVVNLPPVASMDDWALGGGVESDVRVEDQRIVEGAVFTEINSRISRLQRMDLENMPFIRITDTGRYHIAVFAVDAANNVSAADTGVSAEELRPVFAESAVQIDQIPPGTSLAFDRPAIVTSLPDGTLLVELDSYPLVDLVATDEESGVEASFFRFGGRNRPQEVSGLAACNPVIEEIPGTGEFVRFGGVIRLDASGPEFEDDIFFFSTDRAGNRSSIRKATIRVSLSGTDADIIPPHVRDIIPKSGKIDLSRNAHIQFFIQDDDSGVDVDSVAVVVNGVEFSLKSRPAIQLRYTPPPDRRDIEFLFVSVVNSNLILTDNFGVHTFLDGTVQKEARLSFDDDRFDTIAEVIDFLNRIPGMSAAVSATSLSSLNSRLLRDIDNVKVFDRSSPAFGSLAQVTLLSLEEENPQFAFFQRSKGFVIDVNPRAMFDSRSEVTVEINAKDFVGNSMDTMRLNFTAQQIRTLTAEERSDVTRRSKRFFDRLQDNTASNYRKNPFTNQAGFFKAYAQEYATMERQAVSAASNARFDTVGTTSLYRGFGSLMDVPGTQFISQQAYRRLLFSLRNAYLEGSNPITMRQVLTAWAPGGVQVTDLVDVSPDIADQHKIGIAVFFDEETRRHIVTHPDPLKSGFPEFVRDFRPAHLSFGLSFGFQEQFEFQAGCEPVCVTEEGFRATRLIIEPTSVTVTVRGKLGEDELSRLRSTGLEICVVDEPAIRGGSPICPDEVSDTRTKIHGFAQRSRIQALESDTAVLGVEVKDPGAECQCTEQCDGGCVRQAPAELSKAVSCCAVAPGQQVVWGPVESVDYFNREYTTKSGVIRVFAEEGQISVARRTFQPLDGCDRIELFECVDFDEIQVGDCVVAMGTFEGRTPVLRDGPWFDLWLTQETYDRIRDCNPDLPDEVATFDSNGNANGGYVGIDPDTGLLREPPYTDYQRSLLLSAEREAAPADRTQLVPGHTAFREIVAKLEACPNSGCELVVKNRPTAICECLMVGLEFTLCENLRQDSSEVENVAKIWHEDVTEQWDGSGVYVIRGRPMLSPSDFVGDLRLASKPHEVRTYIDCEMATSTFDPLRGTVCVSPTPEDGQKVVVQYYGNEHASVESEKYHFTVHEDGGMDLLDRSKLTGQGGNALIKSRVDRAACESLDIVNARNADFHVQSCLVEPNQLQPPVQCSEAKPFAVRGFNETRLEPHKLNQDFFLNAFPGLRKASPLHAPAIDHMPSACIELQEIRMLRSWNDTKTATNDPALRKQAVDFLDGPKLPDLDVDFTEICLCGQYYYGGEFHNIYAELLDRTVESRRQCFGFLDHDTRIIHFAAENTVISAPSFACYGYGGEEYGQVYSSYYHYFRCSEVAPVSGDGPTVTDGCVSVFERNPWIAPLFAVREEPFWMVEGSEEPFPIGLPVG